MLPSVDKFLGRRYDRKNYNCLHFARDVWLELTNVDIGIHLGMDPDQVVTREKVVPFKRLDKEIDPCLVLMKGRRDSHLGVYVRGKVLHLQVQGAEHQPVGIASRGFKTVRFYTC